MTAIGALCPHNDIQNCVSCEYEIGTKTTLFIMLTEYKRLLDIYHTAVLKWKNEERVHCKGCSSTSD